MRAAPTLPAALLPSGGARSRVRTKRSVVSIELQSPKSYIVASCTAARGPESAAGADCVEGEVEGDRAGVEASAFQGVLRFCNCASPTADRKAELTVCRGGKSEHRSQSISLSRDAPDAPHAASVHSHACCSRWFRLIALLPTSAAAQLTAQQAALIERGFKVFTTQTFKGNGRTCSTCHLPQADFNVSPADIPTLSAHQKKLLFAPNVKPGAAGSGSLENHDDGGKSRPVQHQRRSGRSGDGSGNRQHSGRSVSRFDDDCGAGFHDLESSTRLLLLQLASGAGREWHRPGPVQLPRRPAVSLEPGRYFADRRLP